MVSPAEVTVAIPTIPDREHFYRRALASVGRQTVRAAMVSARMDRDRLGAADNRNGLLVDISTPWVAWLDDDDEFLPHHLEALCAAQDDTGADVVYPDAVRRYPGSPAVPGERWHRLWDPTVPASAGGIPVTVLIRTELCRAAGFGPWDDRAPYEDYGMFRRAADLGASFHHVCDATWVWHIHPGSTSGRPG